MCVGEFSAWKDGWRGTSAEELLLVTVREKRKETEGKDGWRKRERGDESNTAEQTGEAFILKIFTYYSSHTL